MFKIKYISVGVHDTSFGGFPYVATVLVDVDAKEWSKLKRAKDLGSLYGIDIGNAVSKINPMIPAWNPMVDDKRNAKNGVKSITLEYHFKDHDKAEKLGMKVIRMKNGEAFPSYGTHSIVYDSKAPSISAVVTEFTGANALKRIYG